MSKKVWMTKENSTGKPMLLLRLWSHKAPLYKWLSSIEKQLVLAESLRLTSFQRLSVCTIYVFTAYEKDYQTVSVKLKLRKSFVNSSTFKKNSKPNPLLRIYRKSFRQAEFAWSVLPGVKYSKNQLINNDTLIWCLDIAYSDFWTSYLSSIDILNLIYKKEVLYYYGINI